MNTRKLDHVSFLVKDVERSRRFYSQYWGSERFRVQVTRIIPVPGSPMISTVLKFTSLVRPRKVAWPRRIRRIVAMVSGYGSHPAFEVENLEAARQHLRTFNVEIVGGPPPRGDGVQQIFICDPDGHMIELFVWEVR